MIPENIKQLLMSSDKEDVALGLIIARKKRIPIKELDKFADWMIMNNLEHWNTMTNSVFMDYLVDKSINFNVVYYKWRKHE
jgi:hypothetical protein